MLTWTERAPTSQDKRAWLITRGEPDAHGFSARYPGRRLHRVQLTDLEEHWSLDASIVGSGLRLIEVIHDDGRGGHVWFEEIPGWVDPLEIPRAPPALAEEPRPPIKPAVKRSHHRARA